jgi:hypothetical protein
MMIQCQRRAWCFFIGHGTDPSKHDVSLWLTRKVVLDLENFVARINVRVVDDMSQILLNAFCGERVKDLKYRIGGNTLFFHFIMKIFDSRFVRLGGNKKASVHF